MNPIPPFFPPIKYPAWPGLGWCLTSLVLTLANGRTLAQDQGPRAAAVDAAGSGEQLEEVVMEPVLVSGKALDALGSAPSATKGQASREELVERPLLRRGELLEAVPGVIVTQHSGGGKANQFFLRGFNLDHGTDFGVFLDGMQVNFRNHAHGQGYADINFIIPEMIGGLDYRKGPYFADLGDLSSAGEADYHIVSSLEQGMASFTWGEDNYYRAFAGDSFDLGAGKLTLGMEYSHEDGPWETGDNFRRLNALIKYHEGTETEFWSLTGMVYDGKWNATDQVARRSILDGSIGRFGRLSDDEGGETSRASLQLLRQWKDGNATTQLSSYLGYYDLNLFSNFTYFLDDPVRGDQFEQQDRRWFAGTSASRLWEYEIGGKKATTLLGLDTRTDLQDGVGLYKTEARRRFRTVREDDVIETSAALFFEQNYQIAEKLRLTGGLRGDLFRFDVESSDPDNTSEKWDGIVNPKLGMVLGPWAETEFYLNGGLGFHSNDARGVTIARDPNTGLKVDPADPLIRTKGAEIGLRTQAVPQVTTTLGLWFLESDSELVYVGDAGTSEAGPGSRRYGMEWAAYYRPVPWFTLDSELALSHARFRNAGEADRIPGSIDTMWSGGVTLGEGDGIFGSLRGRFFAPRPLEETGRIKSKSSFTLNARAGYRRKNWEVAVDVLNLLDRNNNDIEYYYESQLRGESAPVADVHLHPAEPRTVRVTMSYRW
ncbi:MAG: TonB-dependent receptor [Verrucomicrobiales bacterium]|nr:TonB-dependent receptor [Verrucomicrobiales bacterium]